MKVARALSALFVLAAGVLLALSTAAPAQAWHPCPYGPNIPQCDVYVVDTVPGRNCRYCPEGAIEFEDPTLFAYDTFRFDVHDGLSLLDLATRELDKAKAAGLRDQALARFVEAGKLTGGTLKVVTVGVINAKTGYVEPQPMPWLADAAQHLTTGLNSLAGVLPEPRPAISEFDAALAALQQGGELG